MPYKYIARTYGTTFKPGDRVTHTVTGKSGEVRPVRDDPHYYSVRFDGIKHSSPCHPDELTSETH